MIVQHKLNLYRLQVYKMNSIGDNCTELKKQYDACFNVWFTEKFLKGQTDDSMCAPIFKVYQECVKKALKDQNIEFKEIEGDYLSSGFKTPGAEPS